MQRFGALWGKEMEKGVLRGILLGILCKNNHKPPYAAIRSALTMSYKPIKVKVPLSLDCSNDLKSQFCLENLSSSLFSAVISNKTGI